MFNTVGSAVNIIYCITTDGYLMFKIVGDALNIIY
jgi:hypothetical protein